MSGNSYQMDIFGAIANEFSGKEFTKEDLMNKFGESNYRSEEKEEDNYSENKLKQIHEDSEFSIYRAREATHNMKYLRCNLPRGMGEVWTELYKNENNCKQIFKKDIQNNLKAWKDLKHKPGVKKEKVEHHAYKNKIIKDFDLNTALEEESGVQLN